MILVGDAVTQLETLPAESVQMCVTSPPYWGLRDYGVAGQMGLEKTPDEFVARMVDVFRKVRRVLKPDGTLWLNLGDSYAASGKGGSGTSSKLNGGKKTQDMCATVGRTKVVGDLKPKDLVGIPWRVAFALQADGWYLRQDIIWHKPNPMPESVRDRCTKAHEYIFLLAKSDRYLFNQDAIKEPASTTSGWAKQRAKGVNTWKYNDTQARKDSTGQPITYSSFGEGIKPGKSGNAERKQRPGSDMLGIGAQAGSVPWQGTMRIKRSVWTVTTKPFKGAHFATFPPDLIEPCILAGSKEGDIVLDPFFGAGTTGLVAKKHGRKYIGIELNPDYVAIAEERLNVAQLNLEGA